MISCTRISLEDYLFCEATLPALRGDMKTRRIVTTRDYIVKRGGTVLGRKGEVTPPADVETRVVRVTRVSIGREMYYGASGASRGRYLGAKHYERLEAQVEAATAKAKASGLRKDKARRSKLVKRLRRQGWHPAEHAAVLEQLRALSLCDAMAQGAEETLRVAAKRLHLTLDPAGGYWPWKSSGVERQMVFQRDKVSGKAMERILQLVAPCDETQETSVILGHWSGKDAGRGAVGRSPVRLFRQHCARRRSLVICNESCSSKRCPSCMDGRKEMSHASGKVRRTRKSADAIVKARKAAYNRRHGCPEGAFIPSVVYRTYRREARFHQRRIWASSICEDCTGVDGKPAAKRVWARDLAACANLSRLFLSILKDGTRPEYLCARRDLPAGSSDGLRPGGKAHAGAA